MFVLLYYFKGLLTFNGWIRRDNHLKEIVNAVLFKGTTRNNENDSLLLKNNLIHNLVLKQLQDQVNANERVTSGNRKDRRPLQNNVHDNAMKIYRVDMSEEHIFNDKTSFSFQRNFKMSPSYDYMPPLYSPPPNCCCCYAPMMVNFPPPCYFHQCRNFY